MVMQSQNPGWSSTPMAGGASNVDTFSRIMAMRYGGREDDVWSYLDQPGYRTTLGGSSAAPNASWSQNLGSGSVAITGMGRGGTPSDPGGYNWGTLARGIQTVKNEVYNPIADKFAPNVDKKGRFTPRGPANSMYGRYRGKQQQIAYNEQEAAKQQARQQQQNLGNFASNTFATAQKIAASRMASSGVPVTPGASTPLKQGPSRGMPVNLLSPQSQAGAMSSPVFGPQQPPTKATRPSSNRPTVAQVSVKNGQRVTRKGIIIPPGTRSI